MKPKTSLIDTELGPSNFYISTFLNSSVKVSRNDRVIAFHIMIMPLKFNLNCMPGEALTEIQFGRKLFYQLQCYNIYIVRIGD